MKSYNLFDGNPCDGKLSCTGWAGGKLKCYLSAFVLQWANEAQRLYPNANVLAATRNDFKKENRQRFCARTATGDWDLVIIGHSQFEKLPMSRERQEARLKRDLDEISDALIEAKEADNDRITIKELAAARKRAEYMLTRLRDKPKDNIVTFEQTGVDALLIDEAHGYKNDFIFSKMGNVVGLSKARSQKAADMNMKCSYINELHGSERGVIMASGTPVSNSMTEMFVMMRYLMHGELEKHGIHHFDNWSASYGEVVSALELAPSGQGYKLKERFSRFVNVPELMKLFRMIADIQTAEMLKLPVPKMLEGKPITVAVDPSPELSAYVEKLVERSERIYMRQVSSDQDNMLCVTNDGRHAALDMRCIDPEAPDYEGSKVNACVHNVYAIYKETEEQRSAQMIFLDLSTPKADGSFSVYDDMKAKFISLGVAENEIAFIHNAETQEQKEKLFAAVRSGSVRIILGSTERMGQGTNCQKRLIALHNVDCRVIRS